MFGYYNHSTHSLGVSKIPVRYGIVRTVIPKLFQAMLHLDIVKETLNFAFRYEYNFQIKFNE